MAQSFSVAVLGNQGNVGSLSYLEYGLQMFDLCVDQICKLIDSADITKVGELGAQPKMKYSVMAGGRSYPLVSREEVTQTLKNVQIIIILMSTRSYFMTSLSQEFFNYMFIENLAESCHHVVLRITKDTEAGGTSGRTSRRLLSRSSGKVDVDRTMAMYGFVKEKINAKITVIADEDKHKSKDPVSTKIAKLRSEMEREEFKMAVTEPVKETVSAGKSLLGLGQKFSSWLSSLIKSQ